MNGLGKNSINFFIAQVLNEDTSAGFTAYKVCLFKNWMEKAASNLWPSILLLNVY